MRHVQKENSVSKTDKAIYFCKIYKLNSCLWTERYFLTYSPSVTTYFVYFECYALWVLNFFIPLSKNSPAASLDHCLMAIWISLKAENLFYSWTTCWCLMKSIREVGSSNCSTKIELVSSSLQAAQALHNFCTVVRFLWLFPFCSWIPMVSMASKPLGAPCCILDGA